MKKRQIIYKKIKEMRFEIITLLLLSIILTMILLFKNNKLDNTRSTVIIAAISAFFAAISSFANLFESIEIKKQRENLERPVVLGYFDSDYSSAIYFVIENFGNSPAIDVRVKFKNAPIDYAGRSLSDISFLSKPISFLPPGKKYWQIISVGRDFFSKNTSVNFEFEINYSSVFGKNFSEKFNIDLNFLKETTLPRKSIEKCLEDIKKEIHNLQKVIN